MCSDLWNWGVAQFYSNNVLACNYLDKSLQRSLLVSRNPSLPHSIGIGGAFNERLRRDRVI